MLCVALSRWHLTGEEGHVGRALLFAEVTLGAQWKIKT